MIRALAFTAALWGTARLAALPTAALRLCRRLAPPDLRHLVDRVANDDELVDICGWAVTLQRQIDAATATRADTMRTREEAAAFDRRVLEPLRSRHRLLVEQATELRARTLRGHQARARLVVARHPVTEAAGVDGWAVASCIRALVRDLTGAGASGPAAPGPLVGPGRPTRTRRCGGCAPSDCAGKTWVCRSAAAGRRAGSESPGSWARLIP